MLLWSGFFKSIHTITILPLSLRSMVILTYFLTKVTRDIILQFVRLNENLLTAWLFLNKYLFAFCTNTIIHDPVQMVPVSKQMWDTIIFKGTL